MSHSAYIGVTGFKTLYEVQHIVNHVNEYPIGYVMFGITSSNKRLLDPTSSGKTSPKLDAINEMVRAIPSYHLPMIHYYTTNLDQLSDEIIALFDYCEIGYSCGLQINALWPDPEQLRKIHQCYPGDSVQPAMKITLQLPKEALEATNYEIVSKLKEYQGLITYVLIDPSGGTGADFNVLRAATLMKLIDKEISNITPGVAGGFSAENVAERVKELESHTTCDCCGQATLHNYCIDAQGKLRSQMERKPVFPKNAPTIKISSLDLQKTKKYIENALVALYSN